MLVDLGYSVRRLLALLNFPDAPVTALVYCGAPTDPATPRLEQANLFATLTELNHFADPGVSFQSQYGPDGPRIHDAGPPYHSIYLTQLPQRGPEGLRDCIAGSGLVAVEVHISNVYQREEFRHHSYLSGVCKGVIVGLGWRGYLHALESLVADARAADERTQQESILAAKTEA